MSEYRPTIGLEIHAELKTASKMFCGCPNNPHEAKPNTAICPICMAHPGTLPVLNKEAIKSVIKVGLAIGGTISEIAIWDRKNYFYPDIPKGYQISQYKDPLVSGGEVAGVKITRIHLEEDTGKSTHDTHEGSLVDFNRAGVPLMELVTEPVIRSGEEAMHFAEELQLLLRYLGVASANMEKGEMRVEANISVSKTDAFGTKTEVKNLNSFKSVGRAIAYEINRQIAILEKGEKVVQETRGWDEEKGKTFSQRVKEDSHDYRYFPDPDIPTLKLSDVPEFNLDVLKGELGKLPNQVREELKAAGIKEGDIEIYVRNITLKNFFENVTGHITDKRGVAIASNYIISDLLGIAKKRGGDVEEVLETIFTKLTPESFAKLIDMAVAGKINSRGAKEILLLMTEVSGDPESIAKERNLLQIEDIGLITKAIEEAIASNQKVFEDLKSGKVALLQFFVGQVMKTTKGSANPETVKKILEEKMK